MISTRFHLATIYLASAFCLSAVLVLGPAGCAPSRPPGAQGGSSLNGDEAAGERSGLKVQVGNGVEVEVGDGVGVKVGDGVDVKVGDGVDVKAGDGVDVNVDRQGRNVDVKPGGQDAEQP